MTPATNLTFDGIEQPITEWALDYGIAPAVIIARLERGLSNEQAITTPMVTARGQKLKGKHLDSYIASLRFGRRSRSRSNKATLNPRAAVRFFTANGKTMTLSEWAEYLGKSRSTLESRINLGWPIERVLMPADGRKHRHRPGVVFNLEAFEGTGAGRATQEIPEITFSEKAQNA